MLGWMIVALPIQSLHRHLRRLVTCGVGELIEHTAEITLSSLAIKMSGVHIKAENGAGASKLNNTPT